MHGGKHGNKKPAVKKKPQPKTEKAPPKVSVAKNPNKGGLY